MSDLVDRLNNVRLEGTQELCYEAADEIERLTLIVECLESENESFEEENERLTDENERLRNGVIKALEYLDHEAFNCARDTLIDTLVYRPDKPQDGGQQ